MKLYLLIGLLSCFVLVEIAQAEEDFSFDESSGEEPAGNLPSDDEDGDDDGEGSGLGVTEGMDFETETTPNKDSEVDLIDVNPSKKDVMDNNSKDKGENRVLQEPVEKPDLDVETEDDVADAVASSASNPSFLAAIVVGGCIGLLFAVCVIMLLVYRMRKKDEGSYALAYGLDKKPQGNYEYTKGVDSKEYYA